MLANCSRILLRRSAFEVPKTDRLALLQRVAITHNVLLNSAYTAQTLVTTNYSSSARRSYADGATPAKPKAHTGRAKARTTKPTEKSSTTVAKKAAGTAKKPAAKKKASPAKKKATTKSATSAKAKPKKKAARKPRAKKSKSDRQKNLIAKGKERDAIAALKETALVGEFPKTLPQTPYNVLNQELAKETHALAGKAASAKYKNLTPEELEHYNHIANQNRATNEAAYRKVVEAHTPEQIRSANHARRLLKRKYKIRQSVKPIQDERQVKGPSSCYNIFFKERVDSGDLKHMAIADMGKLVGSEWKRLAKEEKDKYIKQQDLDLSRYKFEVKTVYGRDPKPKAAPKATS
ncbi:MAG: hypothetical protein M1835_006708 [Candelina submexicana]|nr:MAG: hypothetical protein M1835_006708 [Candelina submexicana]